MLVAPEDFFGLLQNLVVLFFLIGRGLCRLLKSHVGVLLGNLAIRAWHARGIKQFCEKPLLIKKIVLFWEIIFTF